MNRRSRQNQYFNKGAFFALVAAVCLQAAGCAPQAPLVYPVPRGLTYFTYDQDIRSFDMTATTKIDILWVIDNSSSMETYHDAVAQNTKLFMKHFINNNRLDWKLGMISTTVHQEPFLGFTPSTILDSHSTDPEVKFMKAVQRLKAAGGNGAALNTSNEQTIRPLDDIINDRDYVKFFRPGAALILIMLTDQDDDVDGPAEFKINPVAFAKKLKDFKGRQKILTYGIFGAPDLLCAAESNSTWNFKGSRYQQFMTQFPHYEMPICSLNFGKELAKIGRDIVNKTVTYFPSILLNDLIPDPYSLKLYYDNKLLKSGRDGDGYWYYEQDTNSIQLTNMEFALDGVNSVRVTGYRE
ncbi:VWA domain-containing protein [bacterium]|jgi:hypothetical protein|nr:VWA domain-containing protein [bacterium]